MESGDSSNEDAPPSNPNRKELTRKEQSAAFSVLLTMKTDNGLRRGATMFITNKFGMACCTVYHLWDRAKSMCELGTINSPEFILCKKNSRRNIMYPTGFVQESVKHMPLRKRCTQQKLAKVTGCVKNDSSSLDCCINDLSSLQQTQTNTHGGEQMGKARNSLVIG